uniref:Uncharacterized protein n=1 Tax=Timema shepardi TaxID=629360 RepID=A0A7R9B8Z7_TIMSH|nr:unnamed protein product [Timema shepardi]
MRFFPEYNPAVLVGNWFEEQKKYIPNRLQHFSTYHIDFQSPNHILEPDNNFVPDKCIQNEGLGSELLLPYSNRYRSNYTSSSDLHYNHAVRCKEKTRPRHYNPRFDQWRPQQDWTCGYGNLTHFGLLETKEEEWHKDVSIDIKTTEYRETYQPPLAESYTSTRAAVPKSEATLNSVTLGPTYHKVRVMEVLPYKRLEESYLCDMICAAYNFHNGLLWLCCLDHVRTIALSPTNHKSHSHQHHRHHLSSLSQEVYTSQLVSFDEDEVPSEVKPEEPVLVRKLEA